MNDAVITLLSISATGTVLALLLLLVRHFLRGRLTRTFVYYMWLAVLLRLVIPFGYQLEIPYADRAETSYPAQESVQHQTVQTGTLPQSTVENSVQQPQDNSDTDIWTFLKTNVFTIWLAGAALSFSWYLAAYAVFAVRLRRSLTVPGEGANALFREMSVGRSVHLAYSGLTDSPMLIGLLKPVIVLPPNILPAGNFRNIVLHELSHFDRRDILYKWFVILVSCVHWFNPFMYIIRREIARDCELACDEDVIRKMDTDERQSYGNTLLALASVRGHMAGAIATTMSEGKKNLKARLVSIMKYKKSSKSAVILMTVICIVTLCLGCMVASNGEAGDKDTPPPEPAINEPDTNVPSPTPTPSISQEPTPYSNPRELVFDDEGNVILDENGHLDVSAAVVGCSQSFTIEEVMKLVPYADGALATSLDSRLSRELLKNLENTLSMLAAVPVDDIWTLEATALGMGVELQWDVEAGIISEADCAVLYEDYELPEMERFLLDKVIEWYEKEDI